MRTKLTAIALGAALAFSAGTAMAGVPVATVLQDGVNSTATITQSSNAGGITATINQDAKTSNNNDTITQTGNAEGTSAIVEDETDAALGQSRGARGNTSSVTQTNSLAGAEIYTGGSNNKASIQQVNVVDDPTATLDNAIILNGGSGNTSSIYQHDGSALSARIVRSLNIESPTGSTPSKNNAATVDQSGHLQTATIDQTDAQNSTATVAQSGSGSIGTYGRIYGYDNASITQSGVDDLSHVTQVGTSSAGFLNTATVTQTNRHDTGDIHQFYYSDNGTETQTGSGDTAIINQLDGTYQKANVTQSGDLDVADVDQSGAGGNKADVLQAGRSDLASVNQSGHYQMASLTQTGYGDKGYITQSTSIRGATATMTQGGNNNTGHITQR